MVDVLAFPSRAQEVCESRGGRPGLPVPNSAYKLSVWTYSNIEHGVSERAQEVCVNRGGRPGLYCLWSLWT